MSCQADPGGHPQEKVQEGAKVIYGRLEGLEFPAGKQGLHFARDEK